MNNDACMYAGACGKIGTNSFGGGEYFAILLDDHTHHIRMGIRIFKTQG